MNSFASFLALLGLFQLAQANPSVNCTLDTVAPSEQLTWCPCEGGFFCSRLYVRLCMAFLHLSPPKLILSLRYPLTIKTRRSAELLSL